MRLYLVSQFSQHTLPSGVISFVRITYSVIYGIRQSLSIIGSSVSVILVTMGITIEPVGECRVVYTR